MKARYIFTSLIALFAVAGAFAQGVETDDMYFTAKDREKLNANKASEQAAYASAKKTKQTAAEDDAVNPTDSYSARNVNPEYVARANSQTAKADDQDYFVSNYQYQTANNLNSWNNNFNRQYNNPWYSSNYFGSSINAWNSPYYGSMYDPWGSPWGNPYYQSGWSSSFSYYWGNSYNYGWGGCPYSSFGLAYGYGGGYGSPYNNFWGPSYGYGSGWGYPGTVVIINNGEGRNITYGKRATRGGVVAATPASSSTSRPRAEYYVPNSTSGTRTQYSGGRVATNSGSRQEDYYNRNYRTSQQSYSTPDNNSSDWGNTRSGYSNYNNNNSNNNSSFGRSSTNSSNNSYSAPSRSSSGTSSFSGSGGGGRSRSRD